jgi:(p)ppGpp synthase/HD superfamily hydrolase
VDPIATADAIAAEAHASQVDKAGQPYVGHVRRVASYVDPADTEARVAALLHDVIEDCGITAAELADQGIPAESIDAVELLTRRAEVASADYYQRIRDHPADAYQALGADFDDGARRRSRLP